MSLRPHTHDRSTETLNNPVLPARALILCAGDGRRWGDHLGIKKQLIYFNGESLLDRTCRLLNNNRITDIICVTRDNSIRSPAMTIFTPERCGLLVETILSTVPKWQGRTIILLGDVFFTENSIRRISCFRGDLVIFGRPWASRLVGCTHGELFAMSFSHQCSHKIIQSAQQIVRLASDGARGNMWDLYHYLAHLPLNSGRSESRYFCVIDDITNDFDSPSDYERTRMIYSAMTSRSQFERIGMLLRIAMRLPIHLALRRAVSIGQPILPKS